MRLPLDIFLALRYLRPKRTFVSFITLLSVIGPLLGVAVLIIVNAIMEGFQLNIKQTLMDWQAHLQVYPLYSEVFDESQTAKIMEVLERHGVRCSPLIEAQALVQVNAGKRQQCVPKLAYGVNPAHEKDFTAVLNERFYGSFDLHEKEAVIGWRMAREMRLSIGSEFLMHSPKRLTENIHLSSDGRLDVSKVDEVYLPERVRVIGIFDMGLSDMDANVFYIHQDQAADLTGYEWRSAMSVQGKVKDPMNMLDQVRAIEKDLDKLGPNYTSQIVTWQERNAQLFETLRVEHLMLMFLMTFILLVASFSIAATLITVVVKKTREIGVLKAVGVSNWCVARIFMLQGLIIGIIGSLLGTGVGCLIVVYRQNVANFLSWIVGHDVFPPELYHLQQLPAVLRFSDVMVFNGIAVVICIFSALIPSLFAAFMRPAKSLQEV